MSFDIFWYIPHRVLYVRLSSQTEAGVFETINRQIVQEFQQHPGASFLIIDVSDFSPTIMAWNQIRASQNYLNLNNLEVVLVMGKSKDRLIRLIMLMLFNLSRAGVSFFENRDAVNTFLKRYSLELPAVAPENPKNDA